MAEPVEPGVGGPPVTGAHDDASVVGLAGTNDQTSQPEVSVMSLEPLTGEVVDAPLLEPMTSQLPIDPNPSAPAENIATNADITFEKDKANDIEDQTPPSVVNSHVPHGLVGGANDMNLPSSPALKKQTMGGESSTGELASSTVPVENEEAVDGTDDTAPTMPPAASEKSDIAVGAKDVGSAISPAVSEKKKEMCVSKGHNQESDEEPPNVSTTHPEQPLAPQPPVPASPETVTLVEEDTLSTTQPPVSIVPNFNSEPTSSGDPHVDYDHDEDSSGVLRLRPTRDQWEDFPGILSTARSLGAAKDGCFKVVLPDGLLGPMPDKPAQRVPANAYRTHMMDRTRIWQVGTIPTEGNFPSSADDLGPGYTDDPKKAFEKLRTLFNKNKDRQMRDVRYRVDVPAWNAEQRRTAGVPDKSPLHPLKGDKLDKTKAIIPGIHTPYVYESGPAFGATFQIHAEDFRLSSLNHLYRGRKIWIVIPSAAVDLAEEKLERRGKCSQFMRHRAEFVFPTKLERLTIPYRVIDQRPGETIVILPDAYHEGFSTGYTLAEAKNYAEDNWNVTSYQACDKSCNLPTAIPASYMELISDGDERIDLCAMHDAEMELQRKRKREEEEGLEEQSVEVGEPEAQRPRLSAEVASAG